jgi:hypothetical protein
VIRHRITAQVVAALPFAFLMANAQVRPLRASERLLQLRQDLANLAANP